MSKNVATKTKEDSTMEFVVAPEPEAESLNLGHEPISQELRERVLKEEMEKLDSEAAKHISMRRTKLKQMKADPVLWGGVDEVNKMIGTGSAAALSFGLERSSILCEFSRSYIKHIKYMTTPREEGGRGLSLEDAIKEANAHRYGHDDNATLAMYQRLLYEDPEHIWWESLRELFDREPRFAEDIWKRIKQEQREEFEAGHLCAKIFEGHREWNTPLMRAEFLVVRESMAEQWKPQGGIDTAMVDMLSVTYFQWLQWTRRVVMRSETEPRYESSDFKEYIGRHKRYITRGGERYEHKYSGQWLDGSWDLPYQTEADALAQAIEIADRYRRTFQSQIRALRDWRRYSIPVTITNAQQVNIAADGGQQVNVQRKRKKKTSAQRLKRA